MTSHAPAIEVKELRRRFGRFEAVKGVSLTVEKGEIYGFLGSNGAGKSTTIKMLCGLLEPSGGKAMVAGIDVAQNPEGVKRRIGYMCQKFSLYPDLTAAENIEFFGGIYGMSDKHLRQRRTTLFNLFDLTDRENDFAAELSRGFQQRLALACAIVHEPQVIFLDEPTAGVDPLQRRALWDIIYELSDSGTTVFVTTHFLDEAEFCHRISLITDGELAAEDTPAGLKELLSPWRIYELQGQNPPSVAAALRKVPSVQTAELFGDTVHVMIDATVDPAPIFSSVKGIANIQVIAPTLEDVFLHLSADNTKRNEP